MMYYSFHALTDPGLVRTNNEDSFAFDEAAGLAILADGMGGYNAGEIASGMATSFIKSEMVRWLSAGGHRLSPRHVAQAIETCVDEANLSILNAAISNVHYAGMGTTLVVGVFQGERLVLGHVGDSRCYRLRDTVLEQITKDHSMLQEQVDAGVLTPEQAAVAPGKNLLTRALGVEEMARVEIHEHAVQSGDLYLMCSDGLTDMIDERTIASVLCSGTPMSVMAADLVARANANGGRDNVTVLLTGVRSMPDKPGLMSRLFGIP
jgi:protein phosphatase